MELTEQIDNVEVYTNKYMELADDWLSKRNVDLTDFRKSQFMDLIYYIHDRTEKVSTNEIDKLNHMFDAYTRLCSRFEIVPSIYTFAILSGISKDTFADWSSGDRRAKSVEYAQSYKRWLKVCEGHLADKIENSSAAPIGAIFSAKANYHWRETAPIPADTDLTAEKLQINETKRAFEQFQLEQN